MKRVLGITFKKIRHFNFCAVIMKIEGDIGIGSRVLERPCSQNSYQNPKDVKKWLVWDGLRSSDLDNLYKYVSTPKLYGMSRVFEDLD